ncbi:MAG: ribosome maturation factor RimM [Calditerrivibrio sp.]|nr:ribosome maturation factor RimM [Calditerrivibrio sp.]
MKFIRIGYIKGTHGLDGEMKIVMNTDNIDLIDKLDYLMLGKERKVLFSDEIEYLEPQKDMYLVKLKTLNDIDAASKYKGFEVLIPESVLPNEAEDEVYWFKIDGAKVVDQKGAEIGILCDYIESGSVDVFRIKAGDGKFYLISNNKDHVISINVEQKVVVINEDGLVDEDL